jgi:putative DNA primase/helicase
MLRYWTDGDLLLMDALFRRSDLYRSKWDERHGELSYGQRTLQATLGRF